MPFHLRDKRWACIVAHRRAGKTVACVNELLTRGIASKKERAQFAYIAPYFVQAKQIAWQYLLEYGSDIITRKNESELWIEVKNAVGSTSRIMLFGADNSDRLRGLYLDGCVIDEPADIRPSFFGTIIRPMLADRKGWCVWIGTPKGHNQFYEIYKRSQSNPDWFSMALKASNSNLLSKDELEDAKKHMTDDQYMQEFECSFEAVIQGSVYGKLIRKAIDDGRVVKGLYDPDLPVHTAWDIGYDDLTVCIFWQIVGNEIRVIDVYANNNEGIQHYLERLYGKHIIVDQYGDNGKVLRWHFGELVAGAEHRINYKYGNHFVPHDAANKLMQAGGRSTVNQAHELGVPMRTVSATSQQNGIEAARKTAEITWFDENVDELIEALLQYQFEFDEKLQTFKSKPKHDWTSHYADAYEIIGQVWKSSVISSEAQKPKFFEDLTAKDVFFPEFTIKRADDRI